MPLVIDAHTHILSLADDPEFTAAYGREGSLCICRSMGLLPSERPPTDEEWDRSGFSGKGFLLIGPEDPHSHAHGEDESLHLDDWRKLIESEIHLLAELATIPAEPRHNSAT